MIYKICEYLYLYTSVQKNNEVRFNLKNNIRLTGKTLTGFLSRLIS